MSSKPKRFITIDGVTRSLPEWAKILGESPTLIHKRLEAGWSEEEAVSTPAHDPTDPDLRLPTKNDAEMLLNDMTIDQLPSQLASLIPKGYEGKLLGRYLRSNHRAKFGLWFDKIFYPNHLPK